MARKVKGKDLVQTEKLTQKQDQDASKATADDETNEEIEQPEVDMQPIEVRRVPEDQIRGLTAAQKSEVFTRVINSIDPNVSKAATRFHYKEGAFKMDPPCDNLAVHFAMDGLLIYRDSDAARAQIQSSVGREKVTTSSQVEVETADGETQSQTKTSTILMASPNSTRALKNQFNFCERASQTYNNPMRDHAVATEPPPTVTYSGQVTQWDIFDTYLRALNEEEKEKEKTSGGARSKFSAGGEEEGAAVDVRANNNMTLNEIFASPAMYNVLTTMARMVNQNSEIEAFTDFKTYEDKSREGNRGSFWPLWRLQYDKTQRKTVTAVCWNPEFTDLCAIGYGSYDFMKQGDGLICCYSLKNTNHPEYVFHSESGVMCLDFHPLHSALLCAGFYDGTVAVYDVRSGSNKPIYVSANPAVKHRDPVWQVRWHKEELGNNINFYSVSSDGRVTNWIMNKNELINEEVLQLKLVADNVNLSEEIGSSAVVSDDTTALLGVAGGCAIDFNPFDPSIFIVGTEEGSLHAYSKAYGSQYLHSYRGHNMAVYTVAWNPFHPDVFLSCSADWTVKLWKKDSPLPVLVYDLNCAVGDVQWSPYSSTVFACISADGKLRLFDLDFNKHEPVGEIRVNKKSKLTHVSFNPKSPVVAVTDDRGVVTLLKVSGNLRRMSAPTIAELDPAAEIARLDKLMLVAEPNAEEALLIERLRHRINM